MSIFFPIIKFEGKLENENTLYKVISNYCQNGICKLHLWNTEKKKQISFVYLAMRKHYTLPMKLMFE